MFVQSPLNRLDSFAYRHRVTEVMTSPLLTGPIGLTLGEACDRMSASRISALTVTDAEGRPIGLITERDLINALAKFKGEALHQLVGQVMNSPVITVRDDAFIHLAIARLSRFGIRHLVAVDERGRAVGMVTGRSLLTLRSREASILGDGIASASTALDLYKIKLALPMLAEHLLAEDVQVHDIAAVISQTMRDMTARSAELSLTSMQTDGWGEAPASWCLLILGSAGRGESLLGGDQDNALIHMGGPAEDAWFAEFGRRINQMLSDCGIPMCKGKVMVNNPAWRRSLADWKKEVSRWVLKPEHETVLNVDIFFDFEPVAGDTSLGRDLKDHAISLASDSPFFLQLLAQEIEKAEVPLGMLGGFATEDGRLSVKQFGLMPLVNTARVLAVKHKIMATSTAQRMADLVALGVINETDGAEIEDFRRLYMTVLLEQQLADIGEQREPSSKIKPERFKRPVQSRLKAGFRHLKVVKSLVAHALGR
jgi:CBS domain-containing protein